MWTLVTEPQADSTKKGLKCGVLLHPEAFN